MGRLISTRVPTLVALFWALGGCSQGADRPPELGDRTGTVPPGDAGQDGTPAAADAAMPTCTPADRTCGSLKACGGRVNVVLVAEAAPAPTGGTISDGTYRLTDLRIYTGPGGVMMTNATWFRESIRITTVGGDAGAPEDAGTDAVTSDVQTAGTDPTADADSGTAATAPELIFEDTSETSQMARATSAGTVAIQGTSLILLYQCPPSKPSFAADFSASDTQLVLLLPGQAGLTQITYTKD